MTAARTHRLVKRLHSSLGTAEFHHIQTGLGMRLEFPHHSCIWSMIYISTTVRGIDSDFKDCTRIHKDFRSNALSSPYSGPYNGPERFWVRDRSPAEDYHLKKALLNPRLEGRRYSRLLGDQFNRFKTWPMFFHSVESSGKELRDGFATVWSTFIVAETLLATVAVQPFHTAIALKGWQFKVYGILWTAALLSDYTGLSVTTIFLAFLHAVPAKLSYMWVCNIGAWIAVPIALLVLSTLTSAIATSYSAWVIYGKIVGTICAIGVSFAVWFSVKAANSLAGACVATEALLNKRETTDDSVHLNTHV